MDNRTSTLDNPVDARHLPPDHAVVLEETIYAISHDLRAPLLNFQGFLRRLSEACEKLALHAGQWNLPAGEREAADRLIHDKISLSVQVLESNARRMDRLLTGLLVLSRAGREAPQLRSIALRDLVDVILDDLRPVAAQRNATFLVGQLPTLYGDRIYLDQIFRNLIKNAIQFLSPERPGLISIGCEVAGGAAVCWVRDNGIGIEPRDMKRVFLPFGIVRPAEAPGAGIGLAIVRKLVERMGGGVWVESVPGLESTFYFSLPLAPA